MISVSSSVSSSAFAQLQQQQAARLADQYAARASSLRAQAQSAQNQADRATQQAGSLSAQANQAEGKADTAKTTVDSAAAVGELAKTQSTQIIQAVQRAVPSAVASTDPNTAAPGSGVPPSAGLVNLQGQRIGVRVNVSV